MGKHIYGEWLVPVVDYFTTLKRKEICYEWLLPLISSITVCACFWFWGDSLKALLNLSEVLPTTLAILIGFTITCITVLISSSNSNIDTLKDKKTEGRILGSQEITIYQWILIIFVYILIAEIFLLTFVFFVGFILSLIVTNILVFLFLFIKVFLIVHILLILIRNITNFYFIFFKNL